MEIIVKVSSHAAASNCIHEDFTLRPGFDKSVISSRHFHDSKTEKQSHLLFPSTDSLSMNLLPQFLLP